MAYSNSNVLQKYANVAHSAVLQYRTKKKKINIHVVVYLLCELIIVPPSGSTKR